MSNFSRAARQALTIARRDFTATVFARTFLLFLLTPVFMIGLSVLSGWGAATAGSGVNREQIVVIASPDRGALLTATDRQLRLIFRDASRRAPLRIDIAGPNVERQARALFGTGKDDVAAVLYGPLEHPHILRTPGSYDESAWLAQLAEQTLRAEKAGGAAQLSSADVTEIARVEASASGRSQVAHFAVLGLFLLTLMLSGQAVGGMAEERSNKVIEILAAATPLEAVFFGKLLAAFGSALLFVVFWGAMFIALPRLMPAAMTAMFADLGFAVGLPAFPLLFVAYFAMSYMLLSAVFLGVGAQASTQREIQMMSLPITVFQVAILVIGFFAAAQPTSNIALAAEIFPFSSPQAMIARAANLPGLWPHFVALGWQALWVAIVVTLSARLFRRGVLKSGSPKARRKKTA